MKKFSVLAIIGALVISAGAQDVTRTPTTTTATIGEAYDGTYEADGISEGQEKALSLLSGMVAQRLGATTAQPQAPAQLATKPNAFAIDGVLSWPERIVYRYIPIAGAVAFAGEETDWFGMEGGGSSGGGVALPASTGNGSSIVLVAGPNHGSIEVNTGDQSESE